MGKVSAAHSGSAHQSFVCVHVSSSLCFSRSNLGGAEYTGALCEMERRSPELSGEVFFSDARLVANGFHIRLCPGQEEDLLSVC